MYKYQSKKKVNEQFGRKMNEDVNGNRKLFWKEVSNAKGRKDGSVRFPQGEDEAQNIWNEYFEDIYNIDIQEQSTCFAFDRIRRGKYFGGEPIGRAEVEVRVGNFKNAKATVYRRNDKRWR